MRRLHLIELEDLRWMPRPIRDGATDLLDLAFDRLGIYDGVLPRLTAALDATRATRLVDLCSGGGGGTLALARRLRAQGRRFDLVLSDLYPSASGMARVHAAGDPSVTYRSDPVDAMSGGGAIAGLRTSAGALHHFQPDDLQRVIAGVVARGMPMALFDVAASPAMRKLPIALVPLPMIVNMTALFIAALVLTPFVRPVRLRSLVLTYLLPAIPLLVAWDGTVSALRAYTPEELLALARGVEGSDRYDWAAVDSGRALALTGIPRVPMGTSGKTAAAAS